MRAWVEVNLDAIEHNIKEIRRVTNKNAKVLAVVKADAYGHGFLEVTKTLIENGADYLGVATFEEAKQLRDCNINTPILIMGPVISMHIKDMVKYDCTITVFDFPTAKMISDVATELNKKASIHIKLDTGMTRIGYLCLKENKQRIMDEILKISLLPNIEIGGIFSHFAKSDEKDKSYSDMQFEKFINICEQLKNRGLNIPIRHICNSAGIIDCPLYHLDMVRSGIITYGHYPSDDVIKNNINLKPAMQFKTVVTNINDIKRGTSVSYNGTFVADKDTKTATIAIGYADGYSRLLSNKSKVIIGGKYANVIGNICMDQCMIDISDISNIKIGDEVILFGFDGDNIITVESVANLMGTINYEVLCVIGKRVPRVYIQNDKEVSVLNYMV